MSLRQTRILSEGVVGTISFFYRFNLLKTFYGSNVEKWNKIKIQLEEVNKKIDHMSTHDMYLPLYDEIYIHVVNRKMLY